MGRNESAEHIKESVPVRLCFCVFAVFVFPGFGKGKGEAFDFVPA
jgi:hypothetical protein